MLLCIALFYSSQALSAGIGGTTPLPEIMHTQLNCFRPDLDNGFRSPYREGEVFDRLTLRFGVSSKDNQALGRLTIEEVIIENWDEIFGDFLTAFVKEVNLNTQFRGLKVESVEVKPHSQKIQRVILTLRDFLSSDTIGSSQIVMDIGPQHLDFFDNRPGELRLSLRRIDTQFFVGQQHYSSVCTISGDLLKNLFKQGLNLNKLL